MQKSILTILICGVFLLNSPLAYGSSKPILNNQLNVGATHDFEKEFEVKRDVSPNSDENPAPSPALGKRFHNNYRVEFELARQKNDLDKAVSSGPGKTPIRSQAESLALMANIYYDFMNKSPLVPFLSAGLGYAKVDMSDLISPESGLLIPGEDDYVLAYQFSAGIGCNLSERVSLDIKYRYFNNEDPDLGIIETEFASHNYYAGMKLSF